MIFYYTITKFQIMPDKVQENISLHTRCADYYESDHVEIFNDIEQARLRDGLAKARNNILSKSVPFKAMDFGCGTGNVTGHLLKLGFSVFACDVTPAFLNITGKRYSNDNLTLCALNGRDLKGFRENSLDLIAAYSVLHHVPDYLSLISEFARVCTPGGIVYIDHEAVETTYSSPLYTEYKKKVTRKDLRRFLRPINYYGKFRRLFDRKFTNEGDIHVWPDDHIEWAKIKDAFGPSFEVVQEESYLLYSNNYNKVIYDDFKGELVDMRLMAFRKRY